LTLTLQNVVVHVRDISHPDTVAQKQNVLQTLSRMLSPQQMNNIVEVCNKADKLQQRLGDKMIPKNVHVQVKKTNSINTQEFPNMVVVYLSSTLL
jgi:50S ribosomal subunit-associated GTPase HflX